MQWTDVTWEKEKAAMNEYGCEVKHEGGCALRKTRLFNANGKIDPPE